MENDSLKPNRLTSEKVPKIAVFRALMLGDLLVAVPALRALRRMHPRAEITLVGLPWARSFAARFARYCNSFLEFPGFPGLPEIQPDIERFPRFLIEAQSRKFDLAIQLHGSGSYVNSIVSLLGARRSAGFYLPGEWIPDERNFLAYPERETEIGRSLRLLEFLNAPAEFLTDELEFPLTSKDYAEFFSLAETADLQGREYICLHAGARFQSRRWQPEKYAAVADALSRAGFRIVLTGTESEREITAAVAARSNTDFLDLTGKTSLGALGVLLCGARLLISNDTGVSHVAAGLGTPRVVVVLGSDAARWQSYDRRLHRVVSEPVECRPCGFEICPIGHRCSENIPPEMVLAEAFDLLETTGKERKNASFMEPGNMEAEKFTLNAFS